MKNILYLFIGLVILFSCAKTEYDPYSFKIDAKNGADIEQEIKFDIKPNVIDSLKISRTDLISMAKKAALYSDLRVKNNLTYEFVDIATLPNNVYLNLSGEYIVFVIYGQVKNNFGVPQKTSSLIKFNSKTKEIKMTELFEGYEAPDVNVLVY